MARPYAQVLGVIRLGVACVSALFLAGFWPGPAAAQAARVDHAIKLAQRRLQRNPSDPLAYYRLGDAYIQKARETGDVAYFVHAEQALRKSLTLAPEQGGVLRHLAFVLYSRHEFAEAALQASRAVALDPADSHAHGILGDAYLEVGRYAEAEAGYERMMQTGQDLYAYSRRAGLRSLRGDVRGAIEDLEQAIALGRAQSRPAESIAWAQWQLGAEHWAVGQLEAAEQAYRAALETYPGYHRALAGLAQVRAAQRRYPEAIDLYQKAIAVIPQPDYAVALGDLYTKLERPADAKPQYALVEYIGRLSALNQALYNRELAYFYVDHDTRLPEALTLARRELEVRRDIYAYDLLSWALCKTGHPDEARTAMREALRLGTRDARLFFHAGMIADRLGDVEGAKRYLRQALETNPHFHVLHAEVAARVLRNLERVPEGGRDAP